MSKYIKWFRHWLSNHKKMKGYTVFSEGPHYDRGKQWVFLKLVDNKVFCIQKQCQIACFLCFLPDQQDCKNSDRLTDPGSWLLCLPDFLFDNFARCFHHSQTNQSVYLVSRECQIASSVGPLIGARSEWLCAHRRQYIKTWLLRNVSTHIWITGHCSAYS